MSRPDPIQYAERLYTAIRAANFSSISFLAFGNAVKDGIDFRRMPRMAAEPFMRVVGEMLDLEEFVDTDTVDAQLSSVATTSPSQTDTAGPAPAPASVPAADSPTSPVLSATERRRRP